MVAVDAVRADAVDAVEVKIILAQPLHPRRDCVPTSALMCLGMEKSQ
jgi:hypothetical protein